MTARVKIDLPECDVCFDSAEYVCAVHGEIPLCNECGCPICSDDEEVSA